MPKTPGSPGTLRHSGSDRSLLERVRTRVETTALALQRRDTRAGTPPELSTEGAGTLSWSPEFRALNVVFHGLGRNHRRYRERTGQPLPPALQAAARAFKHEPSVLSLVPVAGFLDDLGLLKW